MHIIQTCTCVHNYVCTYMHVYTVVWEIFAYRNFHVLIFRVKKFSDVVYLSENFLTGNLNTSSQLVTVNGKRPQGT